MTTRRRAEISSKIDSMDDECIDGRKIWTRWSSKQWRLQEPSPQLHRPTKSLPLQLSILLRIKPKRLCRKTFHLGQPAMRRLLAKRLRMNGKKSAADWQASKLIRRDGQETERSMPILCWIGFGFPETIDIAPAAGPDRKVASENIF
jgi:hypothetical protein